MNATMKQMEKFGSKDFEQLIELGKHAVIVKLHARRNAAYQRAILKAVDRFLHDTPTSLSEALHEVQHNELKPITDDDVLAYLHNR